MYINCDQKEKVSKLWMNVLPYILSLIYRHVTA